jgi:hypothetical protein
MTMIELSKIVADRDFRNDSDEDTEQQQPVTTPVAINAAAIRCYYPRRNDRPGSRITFTDGGGFAVTETYDEIGALLHRAG